MRTSRTRCFVALLGWFLVLVAACQSSSNDATTAADGGPLKCGDSIQDACVTGHYSCVMTWPDDPKAFCAVLGAYPRIVDACGGYHVVFVLGVDRSSYYYYDAASGALVAIVLNDANSGTTACVGPAKFAEPMCPLTGNYVDCSLGDASADGAAGMTGN